MSKLTKKIYNNYYISGDGKTKFGMPTFEACQKLEAKFNKEFSEFSDEQILWFSKNYEKLKTLFQFRDYDLFIYLKTLK